MVAAALCVQMETPGYVDFREALRPFVQRELLRARIHEARQTSGAILTARVKELARELEALRFPDSADLRGAKT